MHRENIILTLCFFCPETFVPPCIGTADFLHAAMRPDMIAETEVEISTEDCCEEEDEDMGTLLEEPDLEHDHEPVRKKKGNEENLLGFASQDYSCVKEVKL